MRVRVNEMTESTIDANGYKSDSFNIYYTGSTISESIPFQKPQGEAFTAELQFYFDF